MVFIFWYSFLLIKSNLSRNNSIELNFNDKENFGFLKYNFYKDFITKYNLNCIIIQIYNGFLAPTDIYCRI